MLTNKYFLGTWQAKVFPATPKVIMNNFEISGNKLSRTKIEPIEERDSSARKDGNRRNILKFTLVMVAGKTLPACHVFKACAHTWSDLMAKAKIRSSTIF